MELLIKIAWRNLWRHKGKSLIIGAILFIGALLMTVGNGVISGMEHGLQTNVVDGFTGNVVIFSDKQEDDNVLFGFMGKAIEPINNYIAIREELKKLDYVEKWLPVGKNFTMCLNEEGGSPNYQYLLGVDLKQYQAMFPNNFKIIEGHPVDTTPWIMLPEGAQKENFNFMGIWFSPEKDTVATSRLPKEAQALGVDLSVKTSMVFMGFNESNSSYDVRIPIKSVMKYKALNTIWGHFIPVDIESYRNSQGYFAAADNGAPVSAQAKKLLTMDNSNLDDLFGGSESFTAEPETDTPVASDIATPIVSNDIDAGAYNLIFLKDKNNKPEQTVTQLNKFFKEKNLGVRATTWRKAIGMVGSMAVLIQGALFVFVMFLFFVAIIIIINTLSMAAIERTTEIGMMRAIGARKSFISSMFFGETAVLSAFFGGAGIVVGIIAINIISALHFTTDNDMVQLLYGGDTFKPMLSIGGVILTFVQLGIVTLIAVAYPVQVAQSITPLDAITRD